MSMKNQTYDELRAQAGPQNVEVKPLGGSVVEEEDGGDSTAAVGGSMPIGSGPRVRSGRAAKASQGEGSISSDDTIGRRVAGGWSQDDGPPPPPPPATIAAVSPDVGDMSWSGRRACFDAPEQIVVGNVVAEREGRPAEAPWNSLFDGRYLSFVYKVDFSGPKEQSRPTEDYSRSMDSHDCTTYMRIHVPCFLLNTDLAHLGVALFMTGGKGTEEGHSSVRLNDADVGLVDQKWLMSVLASGLTHPGLGDPLVTVGEDVNYFRPSDPMVAVTFNYPGRGVVDYPADGAPYFVNDTMENTTGQDHAGALTAAATEAVVAVTLEIVEQLRAGWAGPGQLGSLGHRLVVCSWSWGAYPATRWVASTDHDVHAYVDYEGPSDSEDSVSRAYNPFNVTAVELGRTAGDPPDGLPSQLDFDAWADWYHDYPDYFLCRPPRPLLDELPMDWTDFADGIAAGPIPRFALGEWASRIGLRSWWLQRYDQVFSPPLEDQLETFWAEREPTEWLPELYARHMAYVRVQSDVDHFQPPWMFQRHAVKALNAALSSSYGHVYYTDFDYGDDMSWGTLASPAAWSSTLSTSGSKPDPDDSSEDWAGGKFWAELGKPEDGRVPGAWGTVVDIVRWTADQSFGFRYTAPLIGYPTQAPSRLAPRIARSYRSVPRKM